MLFSKLVICSDIRFLFDLNAGDANTDFSYNSSHSSTCLVSKYQSIYDVG